MISLHPRLSFAVCFGRKTFYFSVLFCPQKPGAKKDKSINSFSFKITAEGESGVQGEHLPGRVQRQSLWWESEGETLNLSRLATISHLPESVTGVVARADSVDILISQESALGIAFKSSEFDRHS